VIICSSTLQFLAGPDTLVTKNAFTQVPRDEGIIILYGDVAPAFGKPYLVNAQLGGYLSQLALIAFIANQASVGVVSQDALNNDPSCLDHPWGIGPNPHARLNCGITRGK